LAGAPVTPDSPFALLWAAGLTGRLPWSAGFSLILLRVQLCLWLAAARIQLQATASSHQKVFTSK